MQALVIGKSVVGDGLEPFKDHHDVCETKSVAWCGPKKVCCCTVEILGPMQVFFMVMALGAIAFLIAEYVRKDGGPDATRTIQWVLWILVCIYLVWLGKSIYVLRGFRMEIDKFRALNNKMRKEVEDLTAQNHEYAAKNTEHEKLNQDLAAQVNSLGHVEQRLSSLSGDCNGSVKQARQFLDRLERNLRLDTLNSVFQFFDRADRNRDTRVSGEEIDMFVDNLGFLWKHLPSFDPGEMKAAIAEQGGITIDQVHKLVEAMMLDQEAHDAVRLSQKLQKALKRSKSDLEVSAETIVPGQADL